MTEATNARPVDVYGSLMLDIDEFRASIGNVDLKRTSYGYYAAGNSIHDLIELGFEGELKVFTVESFYQVYLSMQLSYAEFREFMDGWLEWGGEVYAMRMSPSVG